MNALIRERTLADLVADLQTALDIAADTAGELNHRDLYAVADIVNAAIEYLDDLRLTQHRIDDAERIDAVAASKLEHRQQEEENYLIASRDD